MQVLDAISILALGRRLLRDRLVRRLSGGFTVAAPVDALTREVLRAMLWGRSRFLAAAMLAIGIASVGASCYALGAQDQAARGRQPASKVPATAQGAAARSSRTLELRVLNARTDRPEPGVTVRVRIPARAAGQTDA